MLLTRTPRYRDRSPFAFDLHVLSPPLTFALSQDQTLQLNFSPCLPKQSGLTVERFPDVPEVGDFSVSFYLVESLPSLPKHAAYAALEEDP